MNNNSVRYSDSELEEFKAIIKKKLTRSKEQLELLESQIYEVAENGDSDYGQDMMDDSNTNSDIEMLNNLAFHQRKYIRELENALSRIRHKTYGICEVTGQLIDKKRLMAVPTTTKSLAAKLGNAGNAPGAEQGEEVDEKNSPREKKAPQRQIITKVIRKLPQKRTNDLEDLEDDDDYPEEDDHYQDDEDREIPFQNMDDFADEEDDF